ncbi:MAG: quinolinate synthase NadA, partial [Clostridia bacterium]|nr:quinolinate synthase NadA [Clostridia bacterium]
MQNNRPLGGFKRRNAGCTLQSDRKEFIIVTEIGIMHRLQKENPDKVFIPGSAQAVCPWMKLIRLGD